MIKTNKLQIIPILILLVAILGSCGTQSIKDQIKNTKAIDEYDMKEKIQNVQIVKFGKYFLDEKKKLDLEWIVVQKNEKEAVLICNTVEPIKVWYASKKNQKDYINSDLYKTLVDFSNCCEFSEKESKNIKDFENVKGFFIMSKKEYEEYFRNQSMGIYINKEKFNENLQDEDESIYDWYLQDYLSDGNGYYVDKEGKLQKIKLNPDKDDPRTRIEDYSSYKKYSGLHRKTMQNIEAREFNFDLTRYADFLLSHQKAVRPAIKVAFD